LFHPSFVKRNIQQVEFTSPAEWNPDLNDDNRTTDKMIRQFPTVPHDAVNEFYDLKGNVNLEYLHSVKIAELSNEVDNDDESIDTKMPGLQQRQHEDTSSDDDRVLQTTCKIECKMSPQLSKKGRIKERKNQKHAFC
jgi:hypothetical protein